MDIADLIVLIDLTHIQHDLAPEGSAASGKKARAT
jgi:hypothetical protein